MTSSDRGRRAAGAALVFLAGLALFAWGASQRTAWRTDELRYLEVSREMSLPDGSLIVPQLAGKRYEHKPPGFFWATLALQRGLGLELEPAGKGVSVVSAAASLALVYGLAASMGGVPAGLAAAAVLASAQLYASLAMRANLDGLLAALVTAALWAFARAEGVAGAPVRHAAWLRLLAGGLCGLALLVKGPVALGIPAAVVLAFAALHRGAVRLRSWLPAVAASAVPGLVWLAFARAEAGPHYVSNLVLGHGVAHPLGLVSKLQPFWYYLEQLPLGFLPWSLMIPAAALLAWQRRARSAGDAFALAWALAPVVLLSLFPAKRHLYLLPVYPGIALLVGRWLAWWREPDAPPGPALRWASLAGLRATGALVLVASLAAVALHRDPGRIPGWHLAQIEGLATPFERVALLLSLGLAATVGAVLLSSRSRRTAFGGGFALASATLLLLLAVVHPLQSAGNDSADFYAEVAKQVEGDRVVVLEGTDFAPELQLPDTTIHRVFEAHEVLAPRFRTGPDRELWLIAEEPHLRRSQARGEFETVLRHESPLGKTLLLLRVGDAPAGGAGPEGEAASPDGRRG
ncbi:MAG TPA: glycosyltransferase family 39 protein [Myxococcota bacterium]|nr:glycosyltransferase family 39 protein [Myxococcota bacterium]